jgi:ubiquinone biosynthesis protein
MDFPERFRGMRRFEELIVVLTKYELHYLFYKDFKVLKNSPKTEPETIREVIEELGGGFVKLGQLLSLRPDLVPAAYSQEFSKLQDAVKPFPFADAKKIIEDSTGKKITELFSEFRRAPVASASVGQVYKARLKSGEWVAVKVRRPHVERVFSQDISLMEMMADLIKSIHGTGAIDPCEIVDEFREYTKKELDYREEAGNIKEFYGNFRDTGVKIPLPYLELSTDRVLVMEFVEGLELKKIMEKKDFVEYKLRLARELYNSFLKQVLIDGTFHADLHPGNILAQTKEKEKLAFLDFGITGKLDTKLRAGVLKLFLALMSKDVDGLVDGLLSAGFLPADNREIRRDLRDMLGPYANEGLGKINISKLFSQSIKVARKHNTKVSRDYVLLSKAVLTVESVCAGLSPGFSLIEESKPFLTKLMLHEYSPRKFIARQAFRLEHAKDLAFSIPSFVSKYFSDNEQHNRQIEALSAHIMSAETRMDRLIEKLIFMFLTIILLLSGLLLLRKGPLVKETSVFSIILFCMGAATFIAALLIRIRDR